MNRLAALIVLIVAACSGPIPAPEATADINPSPSPSPAASAETACGAPRDPIDAPTGDSIVAAIPLGCEGGAVAVAGGSVWVVPHLDRVALRIDPDTDTVVGRVPLGDRGPGAEIDAADDMLWASVSSSSYDPDRLVRLDPATGSIVAWVDAPVGGPVIGAGFVWGHGPDGIYKIDPTTDELSAVIDAGQCGVIPFGDRVFCIGSDVVVSIDPDTDAVTPVPGVSGLGWPIAVVDGLIWGIDGASLWAFDPDTAQIVADVTAPEGLPTWSPDGIVLDGILWMTAGTQAGQPPDRLVRVNPATRLIDCVVEVPRPESGIAAGFGSVWLSVVRQPWLLRIEPVC